MIETNFRRWGLIFLAISVCWGSVFAYSIHSVMPLNPIKLPFAEVIGANIFMPQGWKFFTRNPREDDIKVFRKDDNGNWSRATLGANASSVNLFGVRRTARSQGIEIGLLMSSITKEEWTECKGPLEICMESAQSSRVISNVSPQPTICGEVVFVLQPPVPWAWSRAKKEVVMPSKIVKVGVICS